MVGGSLVPAVVSTSTGGRCLKYSVRNKKRGFLFQLKKSSFLWLVRICLCLPNNEYISFTRVPVYTFKKEEEKKEKEEGER